MISSSDKLWGIVLLECLEGSHQQGLEQFIECGLRKFICGIPGKFVEDVPRDHHVYSKELFSQGGCNSSFERRRLLGARYVVAGTARVEIMWTVLGGEVCVI